MSHRHHHTAHRLTDRHAHEAEVYDARADELLTTATDADLQVDPSRPPYANREHVAFLDHALEALGDPAGKRILEVGCGQGQLAVWLATQGATVVALDVSAGNIRVTTRRAAATGVAERVTADTTPIELYAGADASFDAIIGNQVLHHVELDQAMPNIHRMLRPGGITVFCEPVLFVPPMVSRIRDSRAVTRFFPSRKDTPDERAISTDDLSKIAAPFDVASWQPFQVLCRLHNFIPLSDPVFARLERFDGWLLRTFPSTRRGCRYVVSITERGSEPELSRSAS